MEPTGCWRDRTPRWWAAAQWRRTPTDPWSARPRKRRLVEPAGAAPVVARPTPVAAPARVASPRRAGRRKARDYLGEAHRSPEAVQPLRRTDSILRVSLLDSAAARRARKQVVEVAVVPSQVPEPARVPAVAGRADPTAAAVDAVAAARNAAEAAARPIGVVERAEVAPLVERGVRSAELVAGSPGLARVPPRRAPLRGARRKRDRTCWWAGW